MPAKNSSKTENGWLLAACLLCAMGCGGSKDDLTSGDAPSTTPANVEKVVLVRPEPVADDYVGGAVCAECHAEISHRYHTHPMSHSLAGVLEADPLESYDATEFATVPGVSYRVEQTAEGIVHYERRTDSDGEVIYDQAVPVQFEVGSGIRGRSYLINRKGKLLVSPISWYRNGNHWGLSPGYSQSAHPRFERRASDGCLACHAGRMAVDDSQPNRFQPHPFLEEAISCERCHGPAGRHAAYHRQDRAEGADPIVNPEQLDNVRRDAVCLQCHLQGERRVVRYGRSEFDFRPGMALSDVWITFPKTTHVDEEEGGVAVGQAEQMYDSVCFKKGGALTCTSCHDPHGVPAAEERTSFYRSRCLACHTQDETAECALDVAERLAQSPQDSCIDCHMPRFSAIDVAHTAQTDHRVPRFADARQPDAGGGPEPEAEIPRHFVEVGIEIPPAELNRAMGIFYSEITGPRQGAELANAAVELLRPVIASAPEDVDSRIAAGDAHYMLGHNREAAAQWMAVLEQNPSSEAALERMAILYHEARDPAGARGFYERLLEVNPDRAQYYGRYAHVLGQLGEFQLGIETAQKALELDPSLVQAHAWLWEAYRNVNDVERSRAQADIVGRFQSLQPER